MDRFFEFGLVAECPVGEMMGFEVAPGALDVVAFGRILWEPLDGEPMRARLERLSRRVADMDRIVVEHYHNGLSRHGDVTLILLCHKFILRMLR